MTIATLTGSETVVAGVPGEDGGTGVASVRQLRQRQSRPSLDGEANGAGGDARDGVVRGCLGRGDYRGAISECARAFGGALGRFAFGLLGSQAEADEAVQEVLLAAYDGAAGYRAEAPVRGWLFGIARRICARRLDVRERQARRRRLMVDDEVDPSASPERCIDDARRGAALRVALGELRPTEREALLLRFGAELSFREVGAACGVDEVTARQRVSRALARLRDRLVAHDEDT